MERAIAISVEHVSKIFPNGTTALHDVSFSILHSDFVVIGGANGSGKSVLMLLIAQLDAPSTGTVETAGKVGLVFQDADAQILGETVLEDTLFGPRAAGLPKKDADRIARTTLATCGLSEKSDFPARLLSGGEKRRLAVAGVLAIDCPIVIFDEPFTNLDWPGVKQTCAILELLKSHGKTIIVLTHEIEKILGIADRFLILYNGTLCFDGTPDAGLDSDLAQWGIRPPLCSYRDVHDLFWGERDADL